MRYEVTIPGMEGQNVEADVSFLFGLNLLVDGEKVPKGEKSGEMVLTKNDGSRITARWKDRSIRDDFPVLIVDGKEIRVLKSTNCFEFIWTYLPLLFLFQSGFLKFILVAYVIFFNRLVFSVENGNINKICSDCFECFCCSGSKFLL